VTRILVVGAGDPKDTKFICETLDEVNSLYGPVTCLIHANHQQALGWQQAISRSQRTLHKPIVENQLDGIAAGERWRTRLFDEGRPDFVVVFDCLDGPKTRIPKKKIEKIVFMAQRRSIQVLVYSKAKKAQAKAEAAATA
jgi:hypothetical protein